MRVQPDNAGNSVMLTEQGRSYDGEHRDKIKWNVEERNDASPIGR